jgi:predicted polyphosphate/ATP-dependent NAD kinase
MRRRLGFLVNPIAGMGGAVGLKGTDGDALQEARRRGAVPTASGRAEQALAILATHRDSFALLTASGEMGEAQAKAAGIAPRTVFPVASEPTSAKDTTDAVAAMRAEGVDLILFAGGDGTARDIYSVIGSELPMVGIPAGVKMHSGVFATNPKSAARLALLVLEPDRESPRLRQAEIMDRDSSGAVVLVGCAHAPCFPLLLQSAKAASAAGDEADLDAACREVAAEARDARFSIVGPGTTVQRIKRLWGTEGTLLGIDVFRRGEPVALDAGAADLVRIARDGPARLILGVVGGQGYLLGRGNQQINAEVVRAVGRENIIVVASMSKLLSLPEHCLLVDTGDEALDRMLAGHIAVRTGPGRRTIFEVTAP